MFRKKFINKLREKYQFGGPRSGLRNPLLTLQGKSISTDAGQRFGAGAKFSAPLIEAINHGKYATGTRFETDFAGTDAGPISISDKIKAYNASIGVRGYHNRYLNRDNSLSLHSDIGAGIGTGDETLDNEMKPFVDANLSLLKSGRTRKGTNISGGPTLSYGTEGSPTQGLNLGLKGNYGRLSGDLTYDFINKTPRAGVSLNFQGGGVRKFHEGGTADQEHMDMMNNGTLSAHNAEGTSTNAADTSSMYGPNSDNPYGPPPEYGFHFGYDPTADYSNPKSFYDLYKDGAGWGIHGTGFDKLKDKYTGMAKDWAVDTWNDIKPTGKAIKNIGSFFGGLFEEGGVRHQTGGMYDQMRQYQQGGMQLPGGQMQPIPGSDAVEFIGQSHDQGGIMVDPQTEVEGGETMDQVNMAKKGGKRDYFFSSHLKEGGRSYADMHKEILANGGDQEEINMLARMQEKAAGRNPKQVAKLGGVMQYSDGGEFEKFELARLQQLYPDVARENLKEHHAKITAQNTQTKPIPAASKSAPTETYTSPFATKEEERDFQDWVNKDGDVTGGYGWGAKSQAAYDKSYGDYIKSIEEASKALDNADAEVVEEVVEEEVKNDSDVVVDKKRGRLEGLEADQKMFDNLQSMLDAGRTLTPEQQAEYDRISISLGDDRMTTLQRRAEKEKYDKYNEELAKQGKVPPLAYLAGASQLAPAVYSMFHKQPDAEQSVYTPGFTSPIVAERGKASHLERVNYNAERSANAADMRGINKFIETSGGGPANIINKMSAYARKQAGDMKITAAETRANADIANREAQMQQQMDISNMQRAQQASMTNAQLSRAETARMDQIDQLNAQARQKLKDDKEAMKYQGWGLAAQGVAGLAGDVMSYMGQERLAQSIGTDGVYQRDQLRNLIKRQNPGWTDDQVNTFMTSYNNTTNNG